LKNGESSVGLEHLLTHLRDTRGFDFTAYKRSTLVRRIGKRMAEVGVDSYTAYRDHLEVYPEEFAHLFNAILINVTSFFRDAEAFDHLRTIVIPKVIENSHGGDIRVWSAGCASGEEAYSVAVLFAETMGREAFRDRVKIYATDVDEEELTAARAATYSDGDTDGLPAELRERYFEHLGDQ
jgi:two-component system, chemotaxis family, CheB/CheR fusion protein